MKLMKNNQITEDKSVFTTSILPPKKYELLNHIQFKIKSLNLGYNYKE